MTQLELSVFFYCIRCNLNADLYHVVIRDKYFIYLISINTFCCVAKCVNNVLMQLISCIIRDATNNYFSSCSPPCLLSTWWIAMVFCTNLPDL